MAKSLARIKPVKIDIVKYDKNGKPYVAGQDNILVAKAPLGKYQQLTIALTGLVKKLPEYLKSQGATDISQVIDGMDLVGIIEKIPELISFALDEILEIVAIGAGLEKQYLEEKVGLDELIMLVEAIFEVNGINQGAETLKNLLAPGRKK